MENNNCKTCGGYYKYSPEEQALKCTQCGSLKKINNDNRTISSHDFNSIKDAPSLPKDMRKLKCNNCGANIILDRYSIINKCSYCGNSSLVVAENLAGFAPDAVLPFKFGEEQAKLKFKQGIKNKRFVPNVLKRDTPNLQVSSRYVSSYLFTGNLVATYNGVLEFDREKTNSKGETVHYVETKSVSGVMPHTFDYIIEASSNLSQSEFNAVMPYDVSELKPFTAEYLLGSSAEYSDKSFDDANQELETVFRRDISSAIIHKYHADRVKSMTLSFDYKKKDVQYCLLPTYIFNYDYKKKNYKTIMNGQTGKLGGGVPRSPVKITFFVLMIIGIVLGVVALFMLLS